MAQNSKPKLPKDLPQPVGWQLLLVPYKPAEKTKGGIILTDTQLTNDELSSQVAYVVDQGPQAYDNDKKFSAGPWCKIGDWIIISKWGGRKFNYSGTTYRMINDDEVLAVVDDPESVYTTSTVAEYG